MRRSLEMCRSFAATAVAVGTLTLGALAAPVTTAQAQDRLNFTGSANLFDVPESGGSQLFIDFLVGTVGGTPTGSVTAKETVNGVFLPEIVPDVTQGVIQDLTIDNTQVIGLPVDPFLVIGGYTFTITGAAEGNAFGPLSLVGTPAGTAGFFGIFGTVTGGDFGATIHRYDGIFTAQFAGQTPEQVFNAVNSGGTLPVSFSAEFVIEQAAVVPEPSTYLLLATGMGVLWLVSVRRRRAEQL